MKILDIDLLFYELVKLYNQNVELTKKLDNLSETEWLDTVNSINYISECLTTIICLEKVIKLYVNLFPVIFPKTTLGSIFPTDENGKPKNTKTFEKERIKLMQNFPGIDFYKITKIRNALIHGNMCQLFEILKVKNNEDFFEQMLTKEGFKHRALNAIFEIALKLDETNPLKKLVLEDENLIQFNFKYFKKIQRKQP